MTQQDFDAPTTAIDDITGDYTLDASHSRLGFTARHAMVTKVRGQFTDFAGTAHVDANDPSASSVNVTIKTASVETGSPDRDGHLKSGDFFDAETLPEITFKSTSVERDGADWKVTGDLTIKNTTNRSRSPSRRPARPAIPSATCASASRVAPRSAARAGTSPGTLRSRPAASWSPTRSSWSSTSPRSSTPDRTVSAAPGLWGLWGL